MGTACTFAGGAEDAIFFFDGTTAVLQTRPLSKSSDQVMPGTDAAASAA